MKRLAVALLILALVLTNAFWAYTVLDLSITVDYCHQSARRDGETIAVLTSLVRNVPRQGEFRTILDFLRAEYPEEIVKDTPTPGIIEIDGLILEYRDGVLVRVSRM